MVAIFTTGFDQIAFAQKKYFALLSISIKSGKYSLLYKDFIKTLEIQQTSLVKIRQCIFKKKMKL